MKLIDFNWHPSDRQLRQFAVISCVALPLIGWLWRVPESVVAGLAASGLLIAATGLVFPQAIKPLFLGLMMIAAPIGGIIGELAMMLIYFGIFLPIGLWFRIFGRDALGLKMQRSTSSYWAAKKQPSSVASYYRQS